MSNNSRPTELNSSINIENTSQSSSLQPTPYSETIELSTGEPVMSNDSRPTQLNSSIDIKSATPTPNPYSATVVLLDGIEQHQEAFKAELREISDLIQESQNNPQNLQLRDQITNRLKSAVTGAVETHIPVQDCERMIRNSGLDKYWEDIKAEKTSSNNIKDLSQAQAHQEHQAALTERQIAQIKQQAINNYNKIWSEHNKFDYVHASVAEREKWMQDELKMSMQWAQSMTHTAKTKPFNEAKLEIEEQTRQKLKDIEEQKKKMLAVINDSHSSPEEKAQATRQINILEQNERNTTKLYTQVANATNSKDLVTVTKDFERDTDVLIKTATYSLTNQSSEQISEGNRTINREDNPERKSEKLTSNLVNAMPSDEDLNKMYSSLTPQSSEQTSGSNTTINIANNAERKSEKLTSNLVNATLQSEKDIEDLSKTYSSLTNQSSEQISEGNRTINREDNPERKSEKLTSNLVNAMPSDEDLNKMYSSLTPQSPEQTSGSNTTINIANGGSKLSLSDAFTKKSVHKKNSQDISSDNTPSISLSDAVNTADISSASISDPKMDSLLAALKNTPKAPPMTAEQQAPIPPDAEEKVAGTEDAPRLPDAENAGNNEKKLTGVLEFNQQLTLTQLRDGQGRC